MDEMPKLGTAILPTGSGRKGKRTTYRYITIDRFASSDNEGLCR